jgi:proton-dependent oligopeptide transporter, POT family
LTAIPAPQALPAASTGKDLFGHPRGLAYLAFAEAWERFSFYGMQAILVLYMVDQALRPGHIEHIAGFATLRAALEAVFGPLSPQALASEVFGLYAGFVYFTPVFGGLLGDRVLGQRKTVVLGAVLMALGHGLMAIESSFLAALLLLIVGCGCLKGNISAQVGNLYAAGDRRRADAFSVFNVGINLGAFASPLVCGTLGEVFGWSVGFAAAAVGMLLGLAIYVAGFRYLPPDTVRRRGAADAQRPRLAAGDGRTIAALIVVLILGNFFSTAYYQEADVFPLWARDFVDRRVLGVDVPVTWFQSLDGLFTVAFTPLVLWIWRRQTRRGAEPGDLGKIAIGSAIGALAMLLLAIASLIAGAHGRASLGWSVGCFALFGIGFLYQWPTTLALISRSAPPAVNSTMMGAAFLAPFSANLLVGWLGGFYEKLPHATFWLLHAAISGFGAVAILAAFRPLTRLLAPRPGA